MPPVGDALSRAEKGKERGQWARQAPHSPPVMRGPSLSCDRRCSPTSAWHSGSGGEIVLGLVWVAFQNASLLFEKAGMRTV